MPEIKFNGDARKIEDGESVETLLLSSGIETQDVIAVLNGDVVEKTATLLKDGDALDLLRVAGGG